VTAALFATAASFYLIGYLRGRRHRQPDTYIVVNAKDTIR
jgi:hypothetical protein